MPASLLAASDTSMIGSRSVATGAGERRQICDFAVSH